MKKALITGVNSLVNRELLAKLIDMGYEVIAHYHTDNDLTKELIAKHKQVEFIPADFFSDQSISSFIDFVESKAKFSVIVNAATTYLGSGDDTWQIDQQDLQNWVNAFKVNTFVPALLLAKASKLMEKGGVVINISSAMGQPNFAETQFGIYTTSKSALNGLTSLYAKRYAPNIRVVGIAPAYVKSSWNVDMPEAIQKEVLQAHLTAQFVEPAEIANLMETVINTKSINATTLLIDGGYSSPIIK